MRNAFGVCLAVTMAATPAFADGIDDICLGAGRDAEVCACARGAIDDAFPDQSMASYEATARHFVLTTTPEKPEGDWNAALQRSADETGVQLNEVAMMSGEVGQAHQIAIRLCGHRPAPAEADASAEPDAAPDGPPDAAQEAAPEGAPQTAQ